MKGFEAPEIEEHMNDAVEELKLEAAAEVVHNILKNYLDSLLKYSLKSDYGVLINPSTVIGIQSEISKEYAELHDRAKQARRDLARQYIMDANVKVGVSVGRFSLYGELYGSEIESDIQEPAQTTHFSFPSLEMANACVKIAQGRGLTLVISHTFMHTTIPGDPDDVPTIHDITASEDFTAFLEARKNGQAGEPAPDTPSQ